MTLHNFNAKKDILFFAVKCKMCVKKKKKNIQIL